MFVKRETYLEDSPLRHKLLHKQEIRLLGFITNIKVEITRQRNKDIKKSIIKHSPLDHMNNYLKPYFQDHIK